jgi:hypothetical protein
MVISFLLGLLLGNSDRVPVGFRQPRARFRFCLYELDCDGHLVGKLAFTQSVEATMFEAHPRLDQFGIHPDVALPGTLFSDHLLVHGFFSAL